MRPRVRRLARRLAREQTGFTIVEGVVSCMLLALGALSSMQVFDVATRTTYRAEESQALVNRLQAELEEIKGMPYGSVAMIAMPADSEDELDPRSRVNGSSYGVAEDGSSLAPLIVDAANGAVAPAPEAFEIGDISGQIFKFVVWRNDPSCSESLCPGDQDLKRIIVAATVDGSALSFERGYEEIHGDIADPDATPVDNPAPPGDDEDGAVAEFWLTDTPCDNATRQEIVADHAVHNTRGSCSAGMKTGSTPGAPDLMFTEAPELDPDYPADGQPLFDYASDLEPAVNPDLDKGLFLREPSSNGCLVSLLGGLVDLPLLESNRHQKIHKWVSPPMPEDFELLLLGNGTLELWTKTVNGVSQAGRICVTLFTRKLNILGQPVDTPIITVSGSLTYFQHSQSSWPTQWTEISVPMEFIAPGTILPGERIGLMMTAERAGTGNDGLELMYDHPSFESRLQLQTDRALEL